MKVFSLCFMDLKRFIKSPKFWLVIVLSFFFVYDASEALKEMAVMHDVGMTPYFYPVYAADWRNKFYLILLIVIIMSDAPFYNGSETFINIRTGKYTWLFSKLLFVIISNFIFQLVFIVMTIVCFFPYFGLSSKWGALIMNHARDDIGGMFDIVTRYTPIEAMLIEFVIALLIGIVFGIFIFLINASFRNSAGTIFAGVLVCADSFISAVEWKTQPWILDNIPTKWLDISNLSFMNEAGKIQIGTAFLFLAIISMIMSGIAVFLVNRRVIRVTD